MIVRATLLALCAVIWAFAAPAQQAADAVQPEAPGTGAFATSPATRAAVQAKLQGQPVEASDWMIVAANPLAVEAGANVLADGGSAADAMIAAQAVLGLVEPQSSGLGGGGFLVWYDASTGALTTLDAREAAPLSATPRLFQADTGDPMEFFRAVIGGRSVGVPGMPALMQEAHRRWGRTPWPGLFEEAIRLAEDGFAVSPRMAKMVAGDAERLRVHPSTRAYFLPGGTPLAEGETLQNADYAQSLRTLAKEGVAPFYTGDIAREIVQAVRTFPGNPGALSLADLALYRVKERPAVCAPYRGHAVCGMGPPSSGAVAVGQILGLVEPFPLGQMGPDSADAWRLIGDASRLAFADRGRYLADNDFVPVPVKGLLSSEYLRDRATLLDRETALPDVQPGKPDFDHSLLRADHAGHDLPSTTHISIVDAQGNALSMTSSVENVFGARLMVAGFVLNNQLTDFSFRSHADGVPIANRVEPGKRPRSSMAPTIVLKDGAPVLVIGSPGGSRIIPYVANAIIAHLDWGLNVQEAVALPHLVNRFGPYDIEAGTGTERLGTALAELGFTVDVRALTSGLHAISIGGIADQGLRGGADPRREGIALGQ
ncbi:MAG: gamma-glutamyltransferase [Pseudomonadota bacterium]